MGVTVNGPAADLWSIDMIMFEVLMGELPVSGRDWYSNEEVVTREDKSAWEGFGAVLEAQQTWVSSCQICVATCLCSAMPSHAGTVIWADTLQS